MLANDFQALYSKRRIIDVLLEFMLGTSLTMEAMHDFREANHSEVLCIPHIFIFIQVDTYLKLGNSMVIQVSAWTKFDPPNSVVYTVVYTNPFSHRRVSVENELKKANLEDILLAKIVKGRVVLISGVVIYPTIYICHSWVIYGVTCVVTYGVICGHFWSPFVVFLCCHVLRDLRGVSCQSCWFIFSF